MYLSRRLSHKCLSVPNLSLLSRNLFSWEGELLRNTCKFVHPHNNNSPNKKTHYHRIQLWKAASGFGLARPCTSSLNYSGLVISVLAVHAAAVTSGSKIILAIFVVKTQSQFIRMWGWTRWSPRSLQPRLFMILFYDPRVFMIKKFNLKK